METKLIAHIIIQLIITILIAVSFMGFMHKFNKKEYFMSGVYLSAIISFCYLLINFLINIKN